jgi:hypothetical protein
MTTYIEKIKAEYRKRLRHRRNCSHWAKGEQCIDCGYAYGDFIKNALGYRLKGD